VKALIEVSESIRAEPERVFTFVANLAYHPQWVSGLTYISSRDRLTPDLRYQSVSSGMGNEMAGLHLVRQVVPGQLVEIESVTGPFESTIVYSLAAVNGGTWVTCRFVLHSTHPVFGLALPVIEMMARSRLEADLSNLKALCER
jgi:uncharacterized protein YndB with AHSA1/START domain